MSVIPAHGLTLQGEPSGFTSTRRQPLDPTVLPETYHDGADKHLCRFHDYGLCHFMFCIPAFKTASNRTHRPPA